MLNEKLSAWIDGELDEAESEALVTGLLRQAAMRKSCDVTWMVGDVIRAHPQVSEDFTHRVMAALDSEPVVFAPASIPLRSSPPAERRKPSYWGAAAASAAGVAMVAWLGFGQGQDGSGQQMQVAATPARVATPPVQQVIRTARNDDEAYVMAHHASGAGAAMPGAAAFVRTVGNEQVVGAR